MKLHKEYRELEIEDASLLSVHFERLGLGVIEFQQLGCLNIRDSLSVFCATNLGPLIVGTLTIVLHAPVALLSGDISRCESIACWSGLASLLHPPSSDPD